MKDFLPLREAAEKRGKLIQAASARHAPPDEACKLIGQYSQAETKMVKFIDTNSKKCGIPDNVGKQMRTNHKATEIHGAEGLRCGETGKDARPGRPKPERGSGVGTGGIAGSHHTEEGWQHVRHLERQRSYPMTGSPMSDAGARVADSAGNWVDSRAPLWSRPYLRLSRLDRPIGSWLLLMPCWWSAALAAGVAHDVSRLPLTIVLFFIGAFAMRGAGCTWNDITDRDLDARVERTRSRPIPAGQVTVAQAFVFLVAQALVGLVVLLQFNRFAIATGIASLAHRRGLSFHEAHHLLAAGGARPRLFVGRADGICGDAGPHRCGRAGAVCGVDRMGDWL